MKVSSVIFMSVVALLISFSICAAGDFGWMRDFSIKAEADPSGFRAKLASRFKVDKLEIEAVISKVDKLVDAYMVLRLGEMSSQPVDRVVDTYSAAKGQGWGAVAMRLGIKPGSRDFHALKQGQDLYGHREKGKSKDKGKGKGKK